MQSSVCVERGATSLQNLWAMIRYEAEFLGLLSEQRSSALYVFTKPCFPDVQGIEPIHETSVALYTKVNDEGNHGPFIVNLWSLELLAGLPDFKKKYCPFTR